MAPENVKLLAVDDNEDNLTSLRAVLADHLPGVKILTATSGQRGLALARAEDPDVILLDIVLKQWCGAGYDHRFRQRLQIC